MRRLAFLTLVLVLVPLQAYGAGGHPTAQQELAAIENTTQQIRQLKQLQAVNAFFPSDKAFDKAVVANVKRANPDWAITLAEREMIFLGLLPRGTDYHRIIFQGVAGQLLGLYDYYSGVLYVRREANRVFGPDRWAIAHEYTHALQDQHYGAQRLMPDENRLTYRNSDAVSAHHALMEGDAVNIQTLFIERTYSRSDIAALLKLQSSVKTPSLPTAVSRQFYFPYTDGVNFVQTLYHAGGMGSVDAAYRRLPASSYEIMHPSAYLHHWQPVPITLHAVTGFADWKQVDDDVFGAFGYHLLLWQFLNKNTADRLTNAYRGDRYLFLERGKESAMLFKSDWNSAAAARAAEDGFISALKVRYHSAYAASRGSATLVRDPGGYAYISPHGNLLTMAYAPTRQLATRLGTAPTT